MPVSSRTRASTRIFHWEAEGQYGPVRAIRARRGLAASYTGVSGVAATDSVGASYTLGTQHPRTDYYTDSVLGANTFGGIRLDAVSGDRLSWTVARSPAKNALSLYVRFVRAATYSAGACLLAWGGLTGARLTITEYAPDGWIATYNNGSASYSSFTVTGSAVGDLVELLVVLQAGVTNMCRISHCLNFGAVELGSASGNDGAASLVSAFASNTLYLGSGASGASPSLFVPRAVMVDAGVQTLASFRTRHWTMPTTPASTAILDDAGNAITDESDLPLLT